MASILRAKIINTTDPSFWYSKMIGEVFLVRDLVHLHGRGLPGSYPVVDFRPEGPYTFGIDGPMIYQPDCIIIDWDEITPDE